MDLNRQTTTVGPKRRPVFSLADALLPIWPALVLPLLAVHKLPAGLPAPLIIINPLSQLPGLYPSRSRSHSLTSSGPKPIHGPSRVKI